MRGQFGWEEKDGKNWCWRRWEQPVVDYGLCLAPPTNPIHTTINRGLTTVETEQNKSDS
jgi:hypothetical protein